LLPGWTVAHLLTHVARNADSHIRRAEAATRGEVVEQYAGGFEGRAAEIEAGAGRAAAALLDDVRSTGAAVLATWHSLPGAAWDGMTTDVGGRERPLWQLAARRWQELEVHVIDLGTGITHAEWSDDFVAVWLPQLRRFHGDRRPDGLALDEREELAWLYGRFTRSDLPVLAPWA
jgi:maleylpyruvate isomerase